MHDSMSPTKVCMLLSLAVAERTLSIVTAFSPRESREEVKVGKT